MATYQRRRRDGKTRCWTRKTWDEVNRKWTFGDGWCDVPDDEPETRERDPKKEGMILYRVDEFHDGPPVFPIGDILKHLKGDKGDKPEKDE